MCTPLSTPFGKTSEEDNRAPGCSPLDFSSMTINRTRCKIKSDSGVKPMFGNAGTPRVTDLIALSEALPSHLCNF